MKVTRHNKLSIRDKIRLLVESEKKNKATWAAFAAKKKGRA